MSLNKLVFYLQVLVVSLAATSLPAAISINGTCELGNCVSPKILPDGSSTGRQFSILYTLPNSDKFRVTGSYSASDTSGSTTIAFNVRALYVGNATHTASSSDVLNIDLLMDYQTPFNLDGTYSYSQSLVIGKFVAPGSSVETNLYYEGQDVGAIGPFTGAGKHTGSASAPLAGLTAPLTADYRYTYFFSAGSLAVANAAEGGADTDGLSMVGSGKSTSGGHSNE